MLDLVRTMAITYDNINDLAALLREDGDKVLDASSKLSLSAALLHKLNLSFSKLFKQSEDSFHVVSSNGDIIESFLDLQFVYEFLQKTIALKILPGTGSQPVIDLNVFRNLKLLEIHRFSLSLVKGIKSLRTQLQYLTCMRSLGALREVLEWCGGDRSQGFVWCELKEAVFSHNGINSLDTSLEFTPCLQTLDLSHNRIQNAQPLNCLSHLEFLNLSFNRLENIPSFSSNITGRLQVLVLRNNYIEDVQELSLLSKLRELDLGNNCLMDHAALGPLSNLPLLRYLILQGNPLSFHQQHRAMTARYLHSNVASLDFILDNVALNSAERRLVGSLHPSPAPLERSSSFNSTTTASTVVPAERSLPKGSRVDNIRIVAASGQHAEGARRNQSTNTNACLQEEMLGMQDSGFVAGPRPASPSECSIASSTNKSIKYKTAAIEIPLKRTIPDYPAVSSATSLDSTITDDNRSYHGVRYYESDIEVLSNPSQSSIEVLSSGPTTHIRCVHSADVITTVQDQSTNVDLGHLFGEQHRSL